MCLAKVYKESGDSRKLICENIATIDFDENKVMLTDILGRKYEMAEGIKYINLSEGVILLK